MTDEQNLQLDEEEIEILKNFDKMETIPNFEEERAKLHAYAVAHCAKKKVISLRIPEGNILALKKKALEEGMPYQTLIGSVLHKYVTGKLVPRD